MRSRRPLLPLVLALLGPGSAAPAPADPVERPAPPPRRRVERLELLGEARLAPGLVFEGTTVGGLSALAYDPGRGRWYALSDDRSQLGPARFYTLALTLTDGRLARDGVRVEGVTALTTPEGRPFPARSLDPEGLVLCPGGGQLVVSSEGDARSAVPPWLKVFGLDGRERRTLPLPARYLPGRGVGVRPNLAFEALTQVPGDGPLVTAVENALAQDGPAADTRTGSRCRVLFLEPTDGRPLREAVYDVEPVPQPPSPPGGESTNGLPDLLALDDAGTFLALERAYSVGAGVTVRLYEADLSQATDVSGLPALVREDGSQEPVERPARKRLLLDVGSLGVTPDNLEAAALGPTLPDGRRLLVLLSDDNFNPTQVTQVLAFALSFEGPSAQAPQR